MANSLLYYIWFLICLGLAQAKVHLIAQDQAPAQAPAPAQAEAPTPAQAQALGPNKATKHVSDPGSTQARAFFVFGDSLVDSGNNNFLATPARADMPPYGIDFPSHQPTGRFSNGYNIPDLISLSIGSEPTMPYLHPALNGDRLLVGANFASAGIGILNDTGIQFVAIMRMWQQYELFEQYKIRVTEQIGAEKANKLVKESLVLISLGGNDFVNNYYLLPITVRSRQYPLPAYISLLIVEYRTILKKLYELGPRRIIVTGTGPLGCAPAELAMWSVNGECATNLQQAANLFNPQLVQMIKEINKEIGSDVFVTANALDKNMDFITNPGSYGFKTSKEACCGQGPFNGLGLCTPLSRLCDDRNTYVFWDPFHPTEKANRIIVDMILRGSKELMHPFNLTTIMQLDSRK